MGRLEGRVALITGAGRGIGASLARIMAAEGAAVVVNDVGVAMDGSQSAERPADEVVRDITAAGGRAIVNFDSVTDHDAAESMVRSTIDTFGRLDVLVNAAGILRDRMVFNLSEDDWDAVLNVHLKGTFNTTKFASIHWRTEREGHYRIINFTSEAGINGAPGQPNYAAAKAGIIGFTRSCANALERYGVTANCISPRAATRMTASIPNERRSVELRAEAPDRSPDRIAPPVLWLASRDSASVTGRVFIVYGYQVSLLEQPRIERTLVGYEGWNLDEACESIGAAFKPQG